MHTLIATFRAILFTPQMKVALFTVLATAVAGLSAYCGVTGAVPIP